MLYLVHKAPDGEPIGIFSSRANSLYLSTKTPERDWGRQVVLSFSADLTWEDLVDQLTERTSGPHGNWDAFNRPAALLNYVLGDIRKPDQEYLTS